MACIRDMACLHPCSFITRRKLQKSHISEPPFNTKVGYEILPWQWTKRLLEVWHPCFHGCCQGSLVPFLRAQRCKPPKVCSSLLTKSLLVCFSSQTSLPLQLTPNIRLKPVPYRPSTAALWPLTAACWTGPPPPRGHSSLAADTRRAPPEDTPDGSLSAPAGSTRWVPRSVMAASAGSCFPDSTCAASYTGRALGAKSRSEVERARGRTMKGVSSQST